MAAFIHLCALPKTPDGINGRDNWIVVMLVTDTPMSMSALG